MSALILANHDAARHGTRLCLVITSTSIRRVLTLMGLDTIIQAYPSLDTALAASPRRLPQR